MPLNIVILASGSGTNAARIMELAAAGSLDVCVQAVISNRPDAPVLAKAKLAGVPAYGLDHRAHASREAFDQELLTLLSKQHCQMLVLAGYMRLLSAPFFRDWNNRIINIHPALLPAFPGTHGAADALAWGVKITGVTVHFAEEEMDSGPPIIQAAVPIMPTDNVYSLQEKIHALEYRIYPQALQWFAENRVCRQGRKVWIKPGTGKWAHLPDNCFVWPRLEEPF